MNKFYNDVIVDGNSHKLSTLLWDSNSKVIMYAIGSFYSRQLFDQFLIQLQKGCSIRSNGENLYSRKKAYVSKYARAKDENTCDGVHAVIYNTNDRVIRVYEGENAVDKLFNWLKINIQSGLIDEWKSFFYKHLKSEGLVSECIGYDSTGEAPKILVIDNKVDTSLIRNIKSYGLKQGFITLPVENDKEIPTNMSFLDIIKDLIIPYLEEQNCQYNIGEEISPIISSPIIDGNNKFSLYPRQRVIAQGLLNGIKDGLNYVIFNGGTGLGKSMTSTKLAWAIIQEHLHKDKGRMLFLMPGHLVNKWMREIDMCLNPLGVYPNFITINSFEDVKKIPKKPKGLDIIIMPKDRVKRKYLVEHSAIKKYKHMFDKEVINDISNIKKADSNYSDVIIAQVSGITSMKYAAIKAEKVLKKKVVVYTPYYNNDGDIEGYYVGTTSKTLKNKMGTEHKSYDFIFNGTISELKDLISDNILEIKGELITSNYRPIYNPMICPECGGMLYDNPDTLFDTDKFGEFYSFPCDSMNDKNKYCSSYIKADGTPLTSQEIEYIRKGRTHYKVVEGKYTFSYVNDDGEPLTEEELQKAKRNPVGQTILLKVCSHKIFGAKDQKGYRCVDATKHYLKLFGKKSIDVSICDEFHLMGAQSNQGEAFANICRSSKVVIPLSGTITGGKASDLFYVLFRLSPKTMIENGYGYKDISTFIEHFGRRKQETIKYEGNSYNKSGHTVQKAWKEIPGISPMLYNIFLSNNMVSRKIEDLGIQLPKLRYFKHEIEMSEELEYNYNNYKNQFLSFFNKNKGVSVGGSYINGLISYPDMPQQKATYIDNGETLVADPVWMDIDNSLLPKEEKLIQTIRKELSEGRRTLLYATFTGEKGVSKRLLDVLGREFKVVELKGSKVKLEDREDWIEKQYQNGIDCIVTNPECVSTGLNIIQYPTIYFYEIPLNPRTLRQAEKRAYRPNQKFECRIYYCAICC